MATDADTGTTLSSWSITAGNTGSVFAIDGSTGEITVADNTNLDFDTTASHTLSLTVSDGTNTSAVETVSITVTDVATAITAAQSFSIAENAADNSAVGTVATTGDMPTTFSITAGNIGTAFSIDNSGNITVADTSAIDYETLTSYTLTIQASDGTTPVSETVTINITDVNENAVSAISDTDTAGESVAENASVGTSVGITAFATDTDVPDTVTYSLSDDAGGRFAIDTNTGVVTVNGALDAETDTSHSITVVATSTDTSTASQGYSITVTDVDEFDVGGVSDSDGAVNSVAENASIGTTVGVTASATDNDVDDNITYSLSDDAGGRFTIDSSTGVVTVASALDYESASSHNISVLATSDDTSTSSQVFSIAVTDVNDNAPLITAAQSFSVSELAANGFSLGNVVATDVDTGTTLSSWSITGGNTGSVFAINGSTGEITVADNTNLDFDTSPSYTLSLTVSDGTNTSAVETVIINVTDASVSVTPGQSFTIAETDPNGSAVGTVLTTGDAPVSFAITAGNTGGAFSINASGDITINDTSVIDYESNTSFSLTVEAFDGSNTDSQTVTINISDVNEFAVSGISDTDGALNAVAENNLVGSVVGITAQANDGDSTDSITYSLSDDAGGRFTIDSSTGVVTVNGALDAETATSNSITVVATSTDTSTSSETFIITVGDVDEFDISPITDVDATLNAVDENAVAGTAVGITANASDADQSNNTTSYSLLDDAGGLFTIDSNSGVVSVAIPPDYEVATSHSIIVQATSADGSSSSQSFTININPLNDTAPDLVNSTANINEDDANGSIVADLRDETTLSDTDADGDAISYSLISGNDAGAFAIDSATGVVTLVNTTLVDFESTASYELMVEASDGSNSTTATLTISVNNINEAPVIAAPTTVTGNEDEVIAITHLSISDPDAGNADIQVTVNATHGVLTLGDQSSLSSIPVSDDLNHFVISGSLAAINQALAGLQFTPEENYNGAASISVLADDLGQSGAGGALSDTEIISITVIPVNDEPLLDVPDQVEILPGESIEFSTELNNLEPLRDFDSQSTNHNLSMSIENAQLSVNDDTLLGHFTIENDNQLEASGDIATINQILNSLVITPNEGFFGELSLNISLEDEGSVTVGGSRSINTTVQLYVPVPALPDIDNNEKNQVETGVEEGSEGEILPIEFSDSVPGEKAESDDDIDDSTYIPSLEFDMHLGAQGEVVVPEEQLLEVAFNEQLQVQELQTQTSLSLVFKKLDWAGFDPDLLHIEGITFNPAPNGFIDVDGFGEDHQQTRFTVRLAEVTGAGLVVGSVVWLLKGSSLLSSLLISYPAWRGIDPLPVLLPKDKEETEPANNAPPPEKPKNARFELTETTPTP